jgi:predicted amino acid racemase
MQDESSRPSPAEQMDRVQNIVLHMLLRDDAPGPWTVVEVGTALGSQIEAQDALMGLHMAGLIHRHGQFVWATKSAARAMELADFN